MATDSELAWIGFEAWWAVSAWDRDQAESKGQKPPKLFATTTKDLEIRIFGQFDGKTTIKVLPKGSIVRATMMSRFGDIGITDNLKAANGYRLRVMPHDGTLTNYRSEP
jgi:hypothetical protein